MTKKARTETDPFVALNLRAFVESTDTFERSAILAMTFWHWWVDENTGLGIEGIAALGRMSESQAKRVVQSLKHRGWLEVIRPFGGKSRYMLTIEKMTFKDAYSQVCNWLPQSLLTELNMVPVEPIDSSARAINEAPQSQLSICSDLKEKDLKEPDFFDALKADSNLKALNSKAFTDYFWKKHQEKHGVKPIPPKWIFSKATILANQLPMEDLLKRVDNYFNSPHLTSHPFENFVNYPDKYTAPAKDFKAGGTEKRGYAQPDSTDWKHSEDK